jgi:hypothetical protein
MDPAILGAKLALGWPGRPFPSSLACRLTVRAVASLLMQPFLTQPATASVEVMHDDTPESQPRSPKVEGTPRPTEAELSRIAREAVHQPPDARLDKQLVRMGLLDASEPAEPQPARPTSRPVANDTELERLREDLRRARMGLALLAGITAVLAFVVVLLLSR